MRSNYYNHLTIFYIIYRRYNEDLTSYNLIMSSIDEDLIEFSSLNSTVNLSKDQEDSSSDVHLILQPPNNWFNT